MDLCNPTQSLRQLILQAICLVFGVLALMLCTTNFFLSSNFILGTGQVIFAAYSFYLFIKVRKNILIRSQINLYTAMLTGLVIYGIGSTLITTGIIFWSFLLPAVYHVFHPLRVALLASSALFICVTTMVVLKTTGPSPFPVINYTFMYLAIWAISCSHELSRMKIHDALEKAALTDPLTRVKNRLALLQDYKQLIQNKTEVSALYLDIDLFKSINDTYGHTAGDQVLVFTAQLIENTANTEWIYRLGGEEFLIVVEGDVQYGFDVAEEIRQAIYASKLIYHGKELIYSASIGVSKLDLSLGLEQALNPSDLALYQAKSDGRNKVCVNM